MHTKQRRQIHKIECNEFRNAICNETCKIVRGGRSKRKHIHLQHTENTCGPNNDTVRVHYFSKMETTKTTLCNNGFHLGFLG